MIVVNGRFLCQPITGVQRYAYELLRAVDELMYRGDIERLPIEILAPPNVHNVSLFKQIAIRRVGKRKGHAWEQLDLPRFCAGHLLFTPCGGAPLLHAKHVITLHDAGPVDTPQSYSLAYRNWYQLLHGRLARKARKVITVSEFSRQQLMHAYQVPAEKITVTPLSGEHILRTVSDESIVERFRLPRKKYVLAVSSRNPNKNFHGLVEAIRQLKDPDIVVAVAGAKAHPAFKEEQALPSYVRELGYVNDAELRALYEHAGCFVFPSFYEGFGLPPMEAMTLGCPVVLANRASLPEVFGEAALYCDPTSASQIAAKISEALSSQYAIRTRAQAHASRFSWRDCAIQTCKVLRSAADI